MKSDFETSLIEVLYVLLEKAASDCDVIARTCISTLQQVAHSCYHKSVHLFFILFFWKPVVFTFMLL